MLNFFLHNYALGRDLRHEKFLIRKLDVGGMWRNFKEFQALIEDVSHNDAVEAEIQNEFWKYDPDFEYCQLCEKLKTFESDACSFFSDL